MRCSCVKQTFVPRCDLLFSSNRRFFVLYWNNLSNIWCVFQMHFICILYAFYMHFVCIFACILYAFHMRFICMHFWKKRHALLSKMHAFFKNANKTHIKCIQNTFRIPMNFQLICICFIKKNTQL